LRRERPRPVRRERAVILTVGDGSRSFAPSRVNFGAHLIWVNTTS
jgi:hypothetical protein